MTDKEAYERRVTLSTGTLKSIGPAESIPLSLSTLARQQWPDLPQDAKLVLIPLDDFQALIEMTAGRPLLETRHFLCLQLERPQDQIQSPADGQVG